MAKRTDFRQKLMDDLRMRKEKMGNSGNRTAPAADDQWLIRGSKEAANYNSSRKNVVNTDRTNIWLDSRHHKASSCEGSSREIIPVRKSYLDQSIDVSMALALALSNSGKLQNIEFFSKATVGKEHVMHRGSLNFRDHDGRSTSGGFRNPTDQLRFISHLEVGEVWKGVQQLNKILKACSDGISFERNAVDIGRELFQGAMDLEESLRMLITLQEASDHSVGTKAKVRLLKGKEEESSSHEVKKKKVMNTPGFSFDEPQRNSRSTDTESSDTNFIDQNKWALSFLQQSKTLTTNYSKGSSKSSHNVISDNKSVSYDPGYMPDAKLYSLTTRNPHSKELAGFKIDIPGIEKIEEKAIPAGQKVRIPNVVAKLMGLEELPLPKAEVKNCDAQRNWVLKEVAELGKRPMINARDKNSEVLQIPKNKKVTESVKTSTIAECKKVNEMMNSAKRFNKMDNCKKMVEVKVTVEPNSANASEKLKENNHIVRKNTNSAIKHLSKPMDITSIHQTNETMVQREEEAETRETNIEQTCKIEFGRQSADKSIPGHVKRRNVSLPFNSQNGEVSRYKISPRKKGQLIEKKRKLRDEVNVPHNQTNGMKNKPLEPQTEVPTSKIKHTVHERLPQKAQEGITKPHVTLERKGNQKIEGNKSLNDQDNRMFLSDNSTAVASKRSSTGTIVKLLKVNREITHQEKQYTRSGNTSHEVDRGTADKNLRERRPSKTEQRTQKEKGTPMLLETATRKHVDYQNGSHRNSKENPRETDITIPPHQPLKDRTSFIHELEHRRVERSSKSEGNAIGYREMNSQKDMQQSTITANLLPRSCSKAADQSLATNVNDHSITSNVPVAQQLPETPSQDDHIQYITVMEHLSQGPVDSMRYNIATRCQNQKYQVDGQVSLTEKEDNLKQVLIASKHFLHTAEALFKLKIPLGVLQDSENVCPNEGRNIDFDCGCEIIRRKAKREEINTGRRICFAPIKIRSLDALIKELNDDLENLKVSSKVEGGDDDTAECLSKLLEREIQNRNPDINCMWDFGWNNTIFGDTERAEVIRDMENQLFNGLINEIVRDLLSVGTTTEVVV